MITPVPWMAPAIPNPVAKSNAQHVLCTHAFGETGISRRRIRMHQGIGDPMRCEYSGEYFPGSRIRVQWDGKHVGDIYYSEAPKGWR